MKIIAGGKNEFNFWKNSCFTNSKL